MANPALERLLRRTGSPDLIERLAALPLSDLNSLLMEVFRIKASARSGAEVLEAFRSNRFVVPSEVDPISFLGSELAFLSIGKECLFTPLILSPLAPLGSCTFAGLDQNRIVSALRGAEVVADATNVLALRAVEDRRASNFDGGNVQYCASHRFVRAQSFSGKGFSAHFQVFSALTCGRDPGHFGFEKESLLAHLKLYKAILVDYLRLEQVVITLKALKDGDGDPSAAAQVFDHVLKEFRSPSVRLNVEDVPASGHRYYRDIRFSIDMRDEGGLYNIGDGGFVSWAVVLSGNARERMLASGLGTELIWKLRNGIA